MRRQEVRTAAASLALIHHHALILHWQTWGQPRGSDPRQRIANSFVACRCKPVCCSRDEAAAVPINVVRWLFDVAHGPRGRLVPRWIFLRALALIYFSAFYSLLFQIKGLIGPEGILPAQQYLAAVRRAVGPRALLVCAVALLDLGKLDGADGDNVDRADRVGDCLPESLAAAQFLHLLSCVSSRSSAASSVFSSYQSDGMLLEAGFLALFFAPRGLLPGWGASDPPSRASQFLLQWEWFRIYFESGMVKLLSGDLEWRNFTAMDEYYQNGPLPTWIGWYVEHLPHWFHAATVGGTLALELGIVFMMFFPRRVRLDLLLHRYAVGDRRDSHRKLHVPELPGALARGSCCSMTSSCCALFLRAFDRTSRNRSPEPMRRREKSSRCRFLRQSRCQPRPKPEPQCPSERTCSAGSRGAIGARFLLAGSRAGRYCIVMLTWIAYDTTAEMIGIAIARDPFAHSAHRRARALSHRQPVWPVCGDDARPLRDRIPGLERRPELDRYPFRNKPQALNEAPRIYAPYQPRFDWNLWFASLGGWRQNEIVPLTEERLLVSDADVLALFRGNPFPQIPPRYVRAVLWQYWFTSDGRKAAHRQLVAARVSWTLRAGVDDDRGRQFAVVQWPEELPPHD